MSTRLVSEPDFVANRLLPKFKEAAGVLNVLSQIDYHVEKRINGDRADLVAERAGKGLFVLEAKYKKKVGNIERDIEPRDPEVVKQAANYATLGGYLYYGTCNLKRIVLFQMKPGVKAFESEVASFDFDENPKWAEDVLKIALGLVPVKAKALDDSLVSALHEAFTDLYIEFLSSLRERLKNEVFKSRFEDWFGNQGIEYGEENVRKVAEETTYLQINKLLFYYVVKTIYPERLKTLVINENDDVYEVLNGYYDDVKKIDYAPIYQNDVISEIPFTVRTKERFRTLVDTLSEYDFTKMESDFLGRVYEKLIPPQERKRLGQFYTPPEIVDLIAKLTIMDKEAKVLDPACGSGSFLVRAYHRLRELNGMPREISGPLTEEFHKRLIDQVYGIDINQFPAHLSVINLVIQNPKAKIDTVNVVVKDFFDVRPRQVTFTGFDSMTAEGEKTIIKMPYTFDVIVANPPYIRQELLGDKEKEKIFSLIEKEFKDKVFIGKAGRSGAISLDRTSDIYIFFYIHSINFLNKGGKLGFISSNKWLEVGYGESFQEFLLQNVKISFIIEFDRAVFPDAEVNTTVTILQKEPDSTQRNNNVVRFVRLKKRMDVTELQELLELEKDIENRNVRLTTIQQRYLNPGKWNTYLRAPVVFKKIIENTKVQSLSVIADVFRGPTTGYNDYFILSKEKVKEWNIEPEFLVPCISSPKKVKGLIIDLKDITEYFFVCSKPKDELKETNALKYVEFGEHFEVDVTRGSKKGRKRLPQLETIKSRQIWYNLNKPKNTPILFQYMIDEKSRAFLE